MKEEITYNSTMKCRTIQNGKKIEKTMKSRPPSQTPLLFSSSTINYSHKGLIPPHTRQTTTSESQRTMHMTYSTHRQTVHMANSHIALIPFVNPVRPFPPTVSSPSPPPLHKYHLSPLLSFTSTLNFTNILSSLVSLIATPKERCAKSVTVYYSTSQPVPSSQHHPHSWEKITDPCEILRQGVIHLRTICG